MLRSVRYGLYGAVLAGLVAAPVVWRTVDKTVQLSVDGRTTTVRTTASDVGDLLAAQHTSVGGHDLLAPSRTAPLHDGMAVVVRHGRLLRLQVDGRGRQVWTTADTVSQALGQLGYASTDFVSVSRSRRLPLTPSAIAIRTPRPVTVVHDGRVDRVSTTDATVAQLLADLGVSVGPRDRISAAPASALRAGESVLVQRVGERTVSRQVDVAFRTVQRADPSSRVGTTRVASKGVKGLARVYYSQTSLDHRITSSTLVRTVTVRAARPQIVEIGTKKVTRQAVAQLVPMAPTPGPGTAKAIAKQLLAKRGWGSEAQYSCLVQMWTNESGWRVDAANPSGAYGIPQSLPGSKMASAGADWRTNPATQITWGLTYIAARYGTPCDAWSYWQAHGNY